LLVREEGEGEAAPRLDLNTDTTPLLSGGDDTPLAEKATASLKKELFAYAGAIVFIVLAGVASWAVSEHMQLQKDDPGSGPSEVIEWRSQVMGWISALLYRECSCVLYMEHQPMPYVRPQSDREFLKFVRGAV
jgi:hypothetical protein